MRLTGACSTNRVKGRCTHDLAEDPKETGHLEDSGVDGIIVLMCLFKKWDAKGWTGLIWLRIGTGGGLLSIW